MHLIQVINVGQIVGGTAACAWSVTRALPAWHHSVLVLNPITPATHAAFAPIPLTSLAGSDLAGFEACLHRHVREARQQGHEPLVLLHNTAARWQLRKWPCPAIVYAHSAGSLVAADRTVACSHWLAHTRGSNFPVMWQGVPDPHDACTHDPPPARNSPTEPPPEFRVGRLCTPALHKFPEELIALYSHWSREFPQVRWEFVGCPASRQPALLQACEGRAIFHPAGWQARRLLCEWDAWLYTHPRLTESFGRVLAEAMLAGTCPLVDARGGFLEQFPPASEAASHSPSEARPRGLCTTPADFSTHLAWAIAQPTERRKWTTHLQTHAQKHFSLTAFRQRLLTLFTL